MEFTGERVVPGKTDPDLMNEHWARYRFAEPLVHGKRVLDAGCGTGYGSACLAKSARQVLALDASGEALRVVQAEYADPKVVLLEADCGRFPVRDASVDVVVAFEVIEHLENWEALITEAARVLVPHGQFVVSTPNRRYSEESRHEPNPFHAHEFEYREFESELGKHFPHVLLFLENHSDAITFTPPQVEGVRTRLENSDRDPDEAHFFLAVCSKQPQHGSPAFVFLPSGGNVLREREQHVGLLLAEVEKQKVAVANAALELEKLNKYHAESREKAQQAIDALEQENADRTKWAEQQQAEIASIQADRETLIKRLDETEQRVAERSEWAKGLDSELTAVRQQLDRIKSTLAYRASRRFGFFRES